MTNLIIGGASNYTWDQLKFWVNSIKATSFQGDIALVATDISKETIQKLNDEGVILHLYGVRTPSGGYTSGGNGPPPHVARFFFIDEFLRGKYYKIVVVTDTRDVVFQADPCSIIEHMKEHCGADIYCSSEGLKYVDEPWGNANLYQAFGPHVHNRLKNNIIYNVGTIAGTYAHIGDLMSMIFQMSINRPIPIVDQAVFNYLISQEPYMSVRRSLTDYAAQLGTTIEAVKAGCGDIGQRYIQNPSTLINYQLAYQGVQPFISEDGTVFNENNDEFYIVHQYDRIPNLKEKIEKKYGGN